MPAKQPEAMESVPEFVKRPQADWMPAQRGMDSQQQAVVAKATVQCHTKIGVSEH